jgi:hypothetical protein
LNHLRIGSKGGRTFRRIESADSAAGSAADVDETATLREPIMNHVDGLGDGGKDAANGGQDLRILTIHQGGNVESAHLIECGGCAILALGFELVQLHLSSILNGCLRRRRGTIEVSGSMNEGVMDRGLARCARWQVGKLA